MQIRVIKYYSFEVVNPAPCPYDYDCDFCTKHHFGYHGALSPCGIRQWRELDVYVEDSVLSVLPSETQPELPF